MRKLYAFLFVLLFAAMAKGQGQDNCSTATRLCANSIIASSTINTTTVATDPPLSCGDGIVNNSAWFSVSAYTNGFCTIKVALIDSLNGLAVEAYSGACGSLVSTGFCNSASGPAGSMTITFPVLKDSTYHIMVDGNNGNRENFTIQATSSTNSIVGKPVPGFTTSSPAICLHDSVSLHNTTDTTAGGTNLTFQWRINLGSYLNASGADTFITFNTKGQQFPIELKVSNAECGAASATQFIDVVELIASIIPPLNVCIGTPADFSGSAVFDPPITAVNIVSWDWDFGDPASGVNNTANGNPVTHTFVGSGPTFVVRLIATSVECGSDTAYTTVNAKPKPLVNAGANQFICEGLSVTLTAATSLATPPVNYLWAGPGSFTCTTCNPTTVSSLPPGNNTINIHIQDFNGCVADSSVMIRVTPKPVVILGNDTTVCKYSTVQLNANVTTGTAPLAYSWFPCTGLSGGCTIKNPVATVTANQRYCVVVKDSLQCPSDTTCINLSLFTIPTISIAPGSLCATDSPLVATFTVTPPVLGATYRWRLSPNFSLIDSSSADSSIIRVTFPNDTSATYNFTCIVHNPVTGCTDTITAQYQVVPGLNMTLTNSAKICRGDSITLTATGANIYAWTAIPSYAFTDSTLASQIVSPTTTTAFIVTGKIGTCPQTRSATITVKPKPTLTTSSDSIVCPNSTVQLLASATGGTPAYTYSWTPSSGLSSSTTSNPIAVVPSSITYCVTARDSNNCIADSKCVSITVNPPNIVLNMPASICATDTNRNVTLTVTGAQPFTSTYRWLLSANYSLITGSNSDSSTVIATMPTTTGTYSFTVIINDGGTGCLDTLTKTYTVTPGLSMSVAGNNKICFGTSTTLTGNGATSYSWSASPFYAFVDSSAQVQTVSPTTTTTFTLVGTTGSCNQRITYTVTVNPKPSAIAAPIQPFCGCATVTLDGSPSTAGMTYSWASTGGHTITSPSNQNTSSLICVNDSFVLFVTNPSTGCADTASVNAIHLLSPNAVFTRTPDTICNGVSTTVLLDGSGSNTDTGTTYHWTSNNIGTMFADSTALITTATINTATIFHLTVRDSLGCDSTVSDTIHVYPLPNITAVNPFICSSDTNKKANIVLNGFGAGSIFVWDSIPACATPNTASGSSQLFDFASCTPATYPAVYPFYITVTDGVTGCINQVNTTVTLIAGVTLTTTGNISICEGNTAVLTVGGANSYSWSPAGETTSSISVTGLTVAGSPYRITVNGTVGSCSHLDSMFVTVNPVPKTDSIKGSVFVCANDSNLLYTVAPAGGNYTWTITNGVIQSGQNNDSILVKWDTSATGTLTVIDSNSFGCVGNLQTLNVTINPLPVTSAINGPDSLCLNTIGTYTVSNHAGAIYNWTPIGGTIIGSNTIDTAVVQWNTVGVGLLSVYETSPAGCKSAMVQDSIHVYPIPATPSITGNQNVCEGAALEAYAATPDSTASFSWTVTGGSIGSGQGTDSIFVNWGIAGTFTVSVINLSQYGCPSATGVTNVIVNAHPVANVTPDTITICGNAALPLTGTVNTGSIKWTTTGTGTFGNDTLASTIYNPGVTDSGKVVLTMLVTTAYCGNDTDSVIVTIIPAPNANVTAVPAVICSGDTTILVATGGGTYFWSHSGETTDSVKVSPTITTTYSVIVNNVISCPDTGTITITVNPIPQTDSIVGPTSVCVNDSNVLYVVTPITGNYTWTISNGSILSGLNNDSVYVKWDTAGTGTLTVVDTNSFGCHGAPRTLTATINPHPVTSNISGPDTVCENSLIIYTVANHPGASYNWIVSGGTIIGSNNIDTLRVQWGATGTGYLLVNEISNFGCASDTVRDTVYVFSIPLTPLITGDTALCEGDTMQLYTTTPDTMSSFVWTVTGGTIVSGQGNDSLLVNWGTTGAGTISVIDVNQHGCPSDTGFVNVLINPHPVVTVTPDTITICRNTSLPLNGIVNTGTLKWIRSGTGTFTSDTIASPSYTPGATDSGKVVLMLIASTALCGKDTDSVIVTVIPPPVITLLPVAVSSCGDTVTLVATGGGTYLWSPGGATTDSLIVYPTATTTYSVIVNNSFNCPDTSSISLAPTSPGIPNGGPDTIVCRKDSVFLSGFVVNASTLLWSTLGNGTFTDSTLPNTTYLPGTNDTTAGFVKLVLSSTGACRNLSDTITVTFSTTPVADAGPDTTISTGSSTGAIVTLKGTATNTGSIRWTTTGTGTFSPNDATLIGTYTLGPDDFSKDSIIVTLTVTGPCGTDVDYFVIDFTAFTIPNVFTPYPNSPGYNDFFEIIHLPRGSKLKIWDRWGLLVYTSDDYLNDWDAHGLTSDDFYFVLETREKKYHGNIHVIR